jgi:hypothetical protein
VKQLLAGARIRTKVSGVIVLTCSLLLFGTLALVVRAYWTNAYEQRIETIRGAAVTVGHSAAPSLRFKKDQFAFEDLKSLEIVPSVQRATIYWPDGQPFVSWERGQEEATGDGRQLAALAAGESLEGSRLIVTAPITEGTSRAGWIRVESSLT